MRAFLSCSRSLVLPIALSLSLAAPLAKAQRIEPELFQTADSFQVLALPDGGTLVRTDAGFVNGLSVANSSGVLGFAADGTQLPGWGTVAQTIRTLAHDPADGSVLIGGDFSTVSGPGGAQPRARIARLSASGELLPWALAPDADQQALENVLRIAVLGNGDVVFVDAPSGGLQRVCRAEAGAAVYRCPLQFAGTVNVLQALPGGAVLLGGSLQFEEQGPLSALVRLLPDTLQRDPAFNYVGGSQARAATLVDNRLWVSAGTQLQRLGADGSVESELSVDADANILALLPDSSGGFWAAGQFSVIGGAERARVARLSAAGMVDPLWQGPDVQGSVQGLAAQAGRLLLAGRLHSLPAQAVGLLALERLDGGLASGGVPVRLGSRPPSAALLSAATADGGAVFAGSFSHSADEVLPGVLKVDASGALQPGWTTQLPGRITRLIAGPDGFVYTSLESGPTVLTLQYSLRRIRLADAALDAGWHLPLGIRFPTALMIDGGHLWAGYVQRFNGTQSSLLRVSLGAEAVLDPAWDSEVSVNGIASRLIALPDGSVLMLPQPPPPSVIFNPPPPIPPGPRLARFSREAGMGVQSQPFGPEFASGARVGDVVRLADGRLLLTQLSGAVTSGVRRLLADGSLDPDFSVDPGDLLPSGAIALDEARGQLYLAASRPDPTFPSQRIPTIARIDLASAAVDPEWPADASQPGVDVQLSVQGQRVFAGALSLSPLRPLGAFISTSVPPLFADGFEGD